MRVYLAVAKYIHPWLTEFRTSPGYVSPLTTDSSHVFPDHGLHESLHGLS